MLSVTRRGVHRLWCDGCERRLASATRVDRLLGLALEATVVEGGLLCTPADDLEDLGYWHALCPACAADPEAAARQQAERAETLARLLWHP